jgi:hypothetical protein
LDFLDDLLDRKQSYGRRHSQYHDSEHHHSDLNRGNRRHDVDGHHDYNIDSLRQYLPLIKKIIANKPLLLTIAIGGGLLLIAAAALLVALLPTVSPAFDYVNKHGIRGIIETLMPFVNRIWNGQG